MGLAGLSLVMRTMTSGILWTAASWYRRYLGSGLPSTRCFTAPMHSAGLYRFSPSPEGAVQLHKHGVINIATERALNGV